MPSTYWTLRLKIAFRSSLQKPIQEQGLQSSTELLLGQGGLLIEKSGLSLPFPSFRNVHSFSRSAAQFAESDSPPSLVGLQNLCINNLLNKGSKRLINQGRPLSIVGTVTRTFSIPSVSGPSCQICEYHIDCFLKESKQISLGKQFQRRPMAGCNSLSVGAELCARYLDKLSLRDCKFSNLQMRACSSPSYSNKCLDFCRKTSGSLKNREPCSSNLVYGYILFDISGRPGSPSPFSGTGARDFHGSFSAPCSAGAAPDVSFDGSAREDQLGNCPVSPDLKILGDRTLKLLSGSCYLPHPDKEETGGEDAHFICLDEQAIGVADGVGGWAELGVDAGQYARELMSNSVTAIQEEPKGSIDSARVLERAYLSTKAKGSSTACIIALTDQGIHAVNLGDSGFIVVRDGCTILRTPVQQHDFNFTYQLESGNGSDLPSSAQVFTFPVAVGDVIIAGTDGLFDNLYNSEVTAVVVHAVRAGLGPQVTAQKIAALARQRALDKNRQTPFSTAAQDAGYRYYGGKLDDITVVVSYITSSSS